MYISSGMLNSSFEVSQLKKFIRISSLVALITMVSASSGWTMGDFPNPNTLSGVSWGPSAHDLQLGVVVPGSVKSGGPILAQIYVRNTGPHIVITRRGNLDEYKVTIRRQDDTLVKTVRGMPTGFTSDGQLDADLRTGNVYHRALDIGAQYDLSPGVYRIQVSTDVYTGYGVPYAIICTLKSNPLQLVVR